jgi:hypothetical protein
MSQPYSAGALVSTVDDIARWDAAVSSGQLLKAPTWQAAFTRVRLSNGKTADYGYGWQFESVRGVPTITHNGSVNGFLSYVLRVPSEHLYVAVLSNARGGLIRPDIPASKAAAIAMGKPFPEFKATTIDAALLEQYAGVYKDASGATKTLRRAGDKLSVQRPGGPRQPLVAYSDTGFFSPDGLQWYEFRKADGKLQLVTHVDDKETIEERAGPVVERTAVKISDAAFDARAGHYEFPRGFVIDLTREGDRYFAQAKGQPKLEVFPASDTVFFANAIDVELRFENPADAMELTLQQGPNKMAGKKAVQ